MKIIIPKFKSIATMVSELQTFKNENLEITQWSPFSDSITHFSIQQAQKHYFFVNDLMYLNQRLRKYSNSSLSFVFISMTA